MSTPYYTTREITCPELALVNLFEASGISVSRSYVHRNTTYGWSPSARAKSQIMSMQYVLMLWIPYQGMEYSIIKKMMHERQVREGWMYRGHSTDADRIKVEFKHVGGDAQKAQEAVEQLEHLALPETFEHDGLRVSAFLHRLAQVQKHTKELLKYAGETHLTTAVQLFGSLSQEAKQVCTAARNMLKKKSKRSSSASPTSPDSDSK